MLITVIIVIGFVAALLSNNITLFMNKKYNYNLGSLTGYQLIDETVKKYRNYFKNRDKIVSGKLL